MNKSRCCTLLLAIAALVPSVATANEQSANTPAPASPVQITSCRVAVDLRSLEETNHTDEAVAGRLWVTLKNAWPEPATEVTLRIKYGDNTVTLVERGVFSAGARIERTSDIVANERWRGSKPETCAVASVRFANATPWMPAALRGSPL